MKRFLPYILMVVGLFMLFGGIMYGGIFAGVPYQDPTPEMSARYAHHDRIASVICGVGIAVFFLGVFASITRRVARRFRP